LASSDPSKVVVSGEVAYGVAPGTAFVHITGGAAELERITDHLEVVATTTAVATVFVDVVTGAVFGTISNTTTADGSLQVTVDVNQGFTNEGQVSAAHTTHTHIQTHTQVTQVTRVTRATHK
jgi:succinyl-CoA synthetase beta subunit